MIARPSFSIRLLVLATALAVGGASAPAFAQSLDNKGTDFLMMFLRNTSGGTVSDQVQLHLTSDTATDVTVEYPAISPTFTTTVGVVPGTVTIVTLPVTASTGWSADLVQDNAVRATAPDEFVAYMINRRTASSDAALALPVDTMNTEYIVQTYSPRFVGAQFGVIAGFDNTTVTITPSNDITGHTAGVPFNVLLDAGEGYFAQSTMTSQILGDLSGTTISSDNPVGVVNGDGCTQVPTGTTACDHIFEVAQPVQSWGGTALAQNLPNRAGSIYRIMAASDNTEIFLDGASLGVINAGQFLETAALAGGHDFSSDDPVNKKIFVTQYMVGQSFSGSVLGDPAMGNMVPDAQYDNAYTFSTVGGGQFVQNFVTIIADDGDVGTLELDGIPVPAGDYTPIVGTGFSAAVVPLIDGTHTTSSANGHGITVEGLNSFDSYIYPGGALFDFIPGGGGEDPLPVCTLTPNGLVVDGLATDDVDEDTNGNGILDEGEDTNGNGVLEVDSGIFFVQLLDGTVNLDLAVDSFVPGAPQVTFQITPSDSSFLGVGTLRATDGSGNTCEEPVQIGDFDTGGELSRTGPRGARVRVRRPSPDTEGVRCVETDPQDPMFPDENDLPFTPFPNGEVEIDVEVSEGDTTVCCEFINTQGDVSAPACQALSGDGPPPGDVCDVDGDGDVDVDDVDAIFEARGEQASGPDDPRDSNGDGIITVNDGRECVLQCDLANCERPTPNCGLLGIEPFLLLGYPLWRRRRSARR